MISQRPSDYACWYILYTNPKQEDRAASNLRAWNVETFIPKLSEQHFSPAKDKVVHTIKPLFPRYIFARFDVTSFLSKIRFTRGVHSVVSFGNKPTPVDDQIVEIIQSQVGQDGYIRIGEVLSPGDKVVVKDGPLKSFTGIFEREMQGSERIVVLLDTVSFQAHMVVPRDLVKKLK